MQEVDPGHEYLLDSLDGGEPVRLVFVKREGEGYPFNVGHHPGTNCQEVDRAQIARIKHLQRQEPSEHNVRAIWRHRESILDFELRAAERHGRKLPDFPIEEIELQPTCKGCGHIGCDGQHKIYPDAKRITGQRDALKREHLSGFEAWWERRKSYHP